MKIRILYILLPWLLAMASCYEDQSNDHLLPKQTLSVTGVAESYTVTAMKEVTLSITPVIDGPEGERRAWWGLVSEKDRYSARIDTLAHTVELHLQRSFLPGEYTLLYYVEDVRTGLSHMLKTHLSARTEFSKGWWVLKTTEAGGTDVDMFPDEGELIPDVLKAAIGTPLEGPAVDMATAEYTYSYTRRELAPDGTETIVQENVPPLIVASARELAVLSLETGVPVARTADMFVEQPATVQIDALCHSYGHLYLGCSGQIYAMGYNNGMLAGIFNSPLLGDTRLPARRSAQPRTKVICFDEAKGSFFTLPESAIRPEYMDDQSDFKLTGLDAEVLTAGPHNMESNFDEATSEVVLRDRSTHRVSIYTFQSNLNSKSGNVKAVRPVAEGKHLHQAEHACVAKDYKELFFTVGRELYMYDIATGTETRQTVFDASEGDVSFLQCVQLNNLKPEPLLCLVVGLSGPQDYTLHIYKFRAGHIVEPAWQTLTGHGAVRRAIYAANVDGFIHRTCLE